MFATLLMNNNAYNTLTESFETLLDFFRFGLSEAQENQIYLGHGTDNTWDEVLTLIFETLHLPLPGDRVLLQARLTQKEKQLLSEQLWLRMKHKIPVPYLTRKAYFCELPFYVDERVLIPRSPIGELIKQEFSPWLAKERVHKILDLCTGSGCIAVALSYAFPQASIDAVDISKEALEVAAINCKQHGLEEVITLIQSDCWQNLPKVNYDLIVSNPPYVSAEEMQGLPAEYHHEPRMALETANNGLEIVERILLNAGDYLSEDGILVVEVGNSEKALEARYPHIPFTWLEFEHGGQGVFLLTQQQLKTYFSS